MATLPKSLPTIPALSRSKSPKPSAAAPRSSSVGRTTKHEPIAASKAKAHFLQLLDQVERDRTSIPITKRGRVVAQLSPVVVETGKSSLDQMIGRLKGSIKITGDIVSPDHDFWGPDWQ